MPVARIRRTGSGALDLDPHFVPPLLDFAASDHLAAIARRLVEILATKSSMLSGVRRQKNLSLAEFGMADIANLRLLYTINFHFPEFRHLFETRHGHPQRLFETMLSPAGCLTTFSTKVHPRDLPVYRHDDLTSCFETNAEMRTKSPFLFWSFPDSNGARSGVWRHHQALQDGGRSRSPAQLGSTCLTGHGEYALFPPGNAL